jgi:L-iditol 2-dehydrogenase
MKALLLKEYLHLEMVEMPRPEIGPDDVMIRVRACGICGSDVHGFDGSTGRRIPPLVMGHEAAGTVAALGSRVKGLREGDRVTFDSTVYCGECRFCRKGKVNLCDNRQVLGVSCADYRRHGAFAEYVSVPRRIVYPLPDSLLFEHAAMIEATSIAVHAVGLAQVSAGNSAAVVGTGMIGLLAIQALSIGGVNPLIAVDVDDGRLALAGQFGASHTYNSATVDAVAAVRDLTEGRGVDLAIEAVGNTGAIGTAIASLQKGGTVVLIGNISPSVDLPLQSVVTREIRLLGSCASSGEIPACIELLASGRIKVGPLIRAGLVSALPWPDRKPDEGSAPTVIQGARSGA